MKRQYLAMMISLVLVQSACSYKESQHQTNELPKSTPQSTTEIKEEDSAFADQFSAPIQEAANLAQTNTAQASVKPIERMQAAKMMSKERVASSYAVGAAMASAPVVMSDSFAMPREERDKFEHFKDNPIKQVATDPVSTFSLDVDTGSYALVRQFVKQGRLPASDSVRTEELINYFNYDYPKTKGEHPFAVNTELTTAPWQPDHYLLRIGVQAQDSHAEQMPAANLVFLVDVSGSMDEPNKLPLVISSLQMLTQQLRPQDKVSLVVYAGRTEVVLEPTSNKADIVAALARLQAGGSTAGASALELAYKMARKGYIKGGVNRILLATDGDFNVGVTSHEQIKDMVKRERETGVTLSTLGFGQGNFNDAMMEQIADVGNGNYSYIDSVSEARKVLVDELSSTFNTVAKDVKVQIEFNPQQVSEYRLIGYENRQLNREDFNNDKVDAGDVGAGKSVTAIYEITPKGAASSVDPLRYQNEKQASASKVVPEFAFLKIRYKQPHATSSTLLTQPLMLPKSITPFTSATNDHRFATAVAGFGQLLRQSSNMGNLSYTQVSQIAQQAKGVDKMGTRAEFIQLVQNVQALSQKPEAQAQAE
ncbi:MAG TPA: VWA domain-containing protein [Agitococcus sp.]|nr:VWA domain-containing protein [Agitococcus sp.]